MVALHSMIAFHMIALYEHMIALYEQIAFYDCIPRLGLDLVMWCDVVMWCLRMMTGRLRWPKHQLIVHREERGRSFMVLLCGWDT